MFGRKILAGLLFAGTCLATGCCHDKQTCCRPSYAPAPRAGCCPTGGVPAVAGPAVAAPAAPVPVQAYSSPAVSYSGLPSASVRCN